MGLTANKLVGARHGRLTGVGESAPAIGRDQGRCAGVWLRQMRRWTPRWRG